MESPDLGGAVDVRVVAQPVEELRAVGLEVDRLELVPLGESLVLASLCDGVVV